MTERRTLKLTKHNRDKARQGVSVAPDGWVLELREPKRSLDQNAALWSLCTQVAKQRPEHMGVRYDADAYKAAFMHACGQEVRFLPTLDGQGVFPYGHRSSQLTKGEMTTLIEWVLAWCATNDIKISHFDDWLLTCPPCPRHSGGRRGEQPMTDLDAMFEEAAAETLASNEAWEANGGAERGRAKSEAERQRRIAAGWEDEDGNSLLPDEPEDDEENEDEDQ